MARKLFEHRFEITNTDTGETIQGTQAEIIAKVREWEHNPEFGVAEFEETLAGCDPHLVLVEI